MSITKTKALARKAAFTRRKIAHSERLDITAQGHLGDFLRRSPARVLAGYLPIRTEIDPRPVMADWVDQGGVVGVPVVLGAGQALKFVAWRPGMEMVAGAFGVEIPVEDTPVVPDVVIVPLAAFDRLGYRLGYGGGFYDRTLAALRAKGRVHAIGFAYSAQEVDAVPREETDQPLDAVATERGVIHLGAFE